MIKRAVCLLLFLLAGWILILYDPPEPDEALSRKSVELYGVVDDISGVGDDIKITIRDVVDSDSIQFCDKLIIYSDNFPNNLKIGNTVCSKGATYGFARPTNHGQFNEFNYYTSLGINARMFAQSITIISDKTDIIAESLRGIRNRYIEILYDCLPDRQAGIVAAIVVGEKSGLDDEIKQLYRENGISHILAISGLHISLIGAGMFFLLRKYVMPMRFAAIVSGIFIFLYGVMVGFPLSARRAVFMMIVMLGARIVGERYDRLNALSLSAVIELIIHPMSLYESGFLLSYGTVLGITVFMGSFSDIISAKNNSYKKSLWDVVSGSLGISIVTLPIIVNSYHEVPIFSVVVNIVLLPLLSMLLGFALIAGGVGMISAYCGKYVFGVVYYILIFYQNFCEMMASVEFGRIVVGQRSDLAIFIYYVSIAVVLVVYNSLSLKKRKAYLVLGLLGINIIVFISPVSSYKISALRSLSGDKLTITNLDIGQGDCTVIRISDKTIMIDGGSTSVKDVGKYRIVPYLKYMGISNIDYVFITHSDLDHISGISEMIEGKQELGISIDNLVLPYINNVDDNYKSFENLADNMGINIRYIKKGDEISVSLSDDKSCIIRCLHPYPDYVWEDANDYSTVLEVDYDEFEGIFMGDLGEHGEVVISDELRDVDYIKVGHHGSKYSSSDEFLDRIRPEIAVASAGKDNRYGHPSPEAVQRLIDHGARVYSTIDSGEVTVATDGRRIEVHEYRGGE